MDPVIITIIVIALVIICVAAYFFLMVFFPEWVGITGPAARKALREHEEGSPASDHDIFKR